MSWLCQDSELTENDWALLNFSTAECQAVNLTRQTKINAPTAGGAITSTSSSDTSNCRKHRIKCEDHFQEWLEDISRDNDDDCNLNVIIAGKTSELANVPFSRSTFAKIKEELGIHGSIVRAINRNTSCAFNTFFFDWGVDNPGRSKAKSIVYNCRTSALWDGETALAVTWFPDTFTTNAVWFGLNLELRNIHGYQLDDAEIIGSRLANSDFPALHPMLLPTIFADFERERQIPLVRKHVQRLVTILVNLSIQNASPSIPAAKKTKIPEPSPPNNGASHLERLKNILGKLICKANDGDPGNKREKSNKWIESSTIPSISPQSSQSVPSKGGAKPDDHPVRLWVEISYLRNGLEDWRAQMIKMIEHVKNIDEENFHLSPMTLQKCPEKINSLRVSGTRIEERLKDLALEYEEFIRKCTLAMEGMVIANQLEMNNISRNDALTNRKISSTNLEVAHRTQRDGYVMKSIAVLGMLFLPGTFVSSFFSMGLFRWIQEDDERTVSPIVWVYACVSATLTILTLGTFYICTTTRSKKGDAEGQADAGAA